MHVSVFHNGECIPECFGAGGGLVAAAQEGVGDASKCGDNDDGLSAVKACPDDVEYLADIVRVGDGTAAEFQDLFHVLLEGVRGNNFRFAVGPMPDG